MPGSTFLGVEYGQVVGGGCGVLQQNAVSSANLGKTVITAQLTNKGTYCVQAFDPVDPRPGGPRRRPELHADGQSSVGQVGQVGQVGRLGKSGRWLPPQPIGSAGRWQPTLHATTDCR